MAIEIKNAEKLACEHKAFENTSGGGDIANHRFVMQCKVCQNDWEHLWYEAPKDFKKNPKFSDDHFINRDTDWLDHPIAIKYCPCCKKEVGPDKIYYYEIKK